MYGDLTLMAIMFGVVRKLYKGIDEGGLNGMEGHEAKALALNVFATDDTQKQKKIMT